MNAALTVTDQNHTDLLGWSVQNCLEGQLGGLCQRFALVQNNKSRGRFLNGDRVPRRSQKGKDLLSDRFQRPFICGIHGNTHERFLILPDLADKPIGRRGLSRSRGAEEQQVL